MQVHNYTLYVYIIIYMYIHVCIYVRSQSLLCNNSEKATTVTSCEGKNSTTIPVKAATCQHSDLAIMLRPICGLSSHNDYKSNAGGFTSARPQCSAFH